MAHQLNDNRCGEKFARAAPVDERLSAISDVQNLAFFALIAATLWVAVRP